jgi:hypothetical protein
VVASIERYQALGEGAMAQLADDDLARGAPDGSNPVGVIAWHVGGNLASRFTEFLTSDGEKPWRDREAEFARRTPSRAELLAHWQRGFAILFAALGELDDPDLHRSVTIRGQELAVHAALCRSLAHVASHVGQIVWVAKSLRGAAWRSLSIPPGGTAAYAADPTHDRPERHAASLRKRADSP